MPPNLFDRGEFQGEVIARLDAINDKMDTFAKGQADHETRVRSLEDDRSKVKGTIASVSAIVGIVVSIAVSTASRWLRGD